MFTCVLKAAPGAFNHTDIWRHPPRGCAVIADPNEVHYAYRVARGERLEFRRWAADAFQGKGLSMVRITGRYPNYIAERK